MLMMPKRDRAAKTKLRANTACGTTPPASPVTAALQDPASLDMTGYPGSKGASGLAERIIRQMPPHRLYVEAFAGRAAVYRRKRRAERSILIDADPNACETLRAFTAGESGVDIVCYSALDYFASFRWSVHPDTLIYFDPPYLRSTRTRLLYDFEFASAEQHELLLTLAKSLPCMVMVSGYKSKLYAKLLKTWRTVEIPAMTRGGMRTEILWCNFSEPDLLHDPRFAGGGYRERENISRKKKRWAAKFAGMDRRERQAIAAALTVCDREAVEMALRTAPAILPADNKSASIGKNK